MTKMVGPYSIRNLIQSTEYLLELTHSLNEEISSLEKTRDEVRLQQKEATKQGSLVKKMTTYMSEELERMESSNSNEKKNPPGTPQVLKNLEKLYGSRHAVNRKHVFERRQVSPGWLPAASSRVYLRTKANPQSHVCLRA